MKILFTLLALTLSFAGSAQAEDLSDREISGTHTESFNLLSVK